MMSQCLTYDMFLRSVLKSRTAHLILKVGIDQIFFTNRGYYDKTDLFPKIVLFIVIGCGQMLKKSLLPPDTKSKKRKFAQEIKTRKNSLVPNSYQNRAIFLQMLFFLEMLFFLQQAISNFHAVGFHQEIVFKSSLEMA